MKITVLSFLSALLLLTLCNNPINAQTHPEGWSMGIGIGNSYGALGAKWQYNADLGNLPVAITYGAGVFPTEYPDATSEVFFAQSINVKLYPTAWEWLYFNAGYVPLGVAQTVYVDPVFTFLAVYQGEVVNGPAVGIGVDDMIGDSKWYYNVGLGAGFAEQNQSGLTLDVGIGFNF